MWPLFAKPLHEGTSKGISDAAVCDHPEALRTRVKGLLEHYQQAVIIEPYLPGREFTVALLGTAAQTQVLGMMEITFNHASPAYGHHEKATYTSAVAYQAVTEHCLASQLATLALQAYTSLGCRDAGRVDIRLDAAGQPHLLEINPLPGLHPVHSDLSIIAKQHHVSYNDLIQHIMTSAISRLELPSDPVTITSPPVLTPPTTGVMS
jgi:D-alanine-D-alanine ligase